jgi:hypothetical protein
MDHGGRAGKAAGVDNFNEISELAELHMIFVALRLVSSICSAFSASPRARLVQFAARPRAYDALAIAG